MRLQTPSLLETAFFTLAILLQTCRGQSSGLTQQYCSSQNTAGDYEPDVWQWQSMGRCYNRCVGTHAFAILQYQSCWCSNFIPSPTVDVAQCSATCPGFPSDLCGNQSGGLFGYMALNIAPSGTYQAAASSSTFVASQTSTPTSSSSTSTSSSTPQSSQSSSTSSTSDSSSSSSSTSESPSTMAAVTSVQVVTVSGGVVYKTVTSTPIPAPAQDANLERVQHDGLSGGAIAGIVIGVLAGLAAILFGLFLLWRRRKSREAEAVTDEKGGRSPRRNISVLSRSGLLARGGHDNTERDFDEPIQPGSSSQRHSMLFGASAAAEGISPVSVLETTHSGDSRRHSTPKVYDQRLNPSALFATHDNGSRASMQDGADYSRTLGVTNPDPRASFDSRFSTT